MTNKSLIAFVVLMLVTVGLLIAQNRSGELSNVSISKLEMEGWLKSLPPDQLRAMVAQKDAKQQLVDNFKQMFSLAAEAERLGVTSQPDVQADLTIMEKLILATLFRDRKAVEQPKAVEVSDEEKDEWLKRNPNAFENFVAGNPKLKKAPEQQREAIKPQFVELMVLVDRARQMGLDKDPAYIMGKKVQRAAYLASRGQQKIRETLKVSDDDLRKEFEAHKDQFAETRASHILVMYPEQRAAHPGQTKPEDEATKPKTKEDARKLAEELLQRVKNGEKFDELAKKYSDDTGSGEKGGDLGYVRANVNFVPEFKTALFKLGVNEVSGIVESPFGYHIIKVLEKRTTPFEEAKADLQDEVVNRKVDEYIKALKDKNIVTIDDTFTMPTPPPAPVPQPGQGNPAIHDEMNPHQPVDDGNPEPRSNQQQQPEQPADKKNTSEKKETPGKDNKAADKTGAAKAGK